MWLDNTLLVVFSSLYWILQIQQFSKKEIEDLLRKGAYAAIMEEDDEGSKFCEEDIDQILLRRTTTITIESEGKGSTFAKVYSICAGSQRSRDRDRNLQNLSVFYYCCYWFTLLKRVLQSTLLCSFVTHQASFVASENRTDISLDDPNFWQKWAKKADLDMDLLNSKVSFLFLRGGNTVEGTVLSGVFIASLILDADLGL